MSGMNPTDNDSMNAKAAVGQKLAHGIDESRFGQMESIPESVADQQLASFLETLRCHPAQPHRDVDKLTALRSEIAIGIAQADRGEFVEFDVEDVIRRGRLRLNAKASGHRSAKQINR
jgi:predicted transcriptional regulator